MIHDDHFSQDIKDPELLAAVARRGWVFLTQDARIRYRPREVDALYNASLRAFVFACANLSAEATVAVFAKARKRVERIAAAETPPFIYRVAKDGSVRNAELDTRRTTQ